MSDELIAVLQDAFWQRAEHLLMHHTNPWELDEALVDWGYAVGPCEAQDHFGLDRVLARAPDRPAPILARMVAEGRLGKQGGVGFYRYPGGGGAVIDPLIEDLIREEAWFAQVVRRDVDADVLVSKMNAALSEALLAQVTEIGDAALVLKQAVFFPVGRMVELNAGRG